jgi:hypothetical protein
MPIICPFCAQENASAALVCATSARDMAVPASLIHERDDLFRKRDDARKELSRVKRELEELERDEKYRLV